MRSAYKKYDNSISFLLAALMGLLFILGCETKNNSSFETPSEIENTEKIPCGDNTAVISLKTYHQKQPTNLFAFLLAGSPVKRYFSEQNKNSHQLLEKLLSNGFNVAEIKYAQQNGFYGACRAQGISNVVAHSNLLYELLVKNLGADPNNPLHKIAGIGYSIGAAQVQAMAFMLGKRIDRVALLGVLIGDVEQGCNSFLENKTDGYSWREFHPFAAALTKNQKGCHSPSEFSSTLNFEKQTYADQWSLAIFEGEVFDQHQFAAGNISQAKYIEKQRRQLKAPVKLYTYPGCGHEILTCSGGKAVEDIFNFVTD